MAEQLALHGGTPVRTEPLAARTHDFGDADIEALARVIRADFNSGTREAFEEAFAARHGVFPAELGVANDCFYSPVSKMSAKDSP
jgi:hypothetical protein